MATILIIEDEDLLLKTLTRALDQHQVIGATTGSEGLRQAKLQKPDLILLDILLPDTDGAVVLRQLKQDPATESIPVLVLTNLSDPETISNIIAVGGTEYFIKTDWSINQIVEKIEETLRGE